MIPEHTVANILETARIEEVIADFITLKKRGANFIARCPFHNEKTPSFSVSPTKGIYKCFGCGAAGNSSKFLMEHEHLSYPEALRYLAKKYHIEIEEEDNEQFKEEKLQRDSLFLINQFAADHFQQNLLHSDEGKSVGLSYFKERGFRDETIAKFQLGYSMNKFDFLLKAAKEKGYKPEDLKKLGLITAKNTKQFDFFRGRVMFTIHNLSGKVIAFAGRTLLKDKKQPKYINSPETEIYFKSKILYGMHLARTAIRKQDMCYLVEGYTDVISMHQAGIENVVASSGTSLTVEQIRLVKRYTPNITILFDGDPAGIKAALRGVDLILQEGMNVKVVMLPEGEDPDSYVSQNGRAEFENYVKEKIQDFVFFKVSLLLDETAGDPVKKSNLIKEVISTLAKIPDPIKRSLYVKECSKLLDISERMIINETNKLKWKDIKKKQERKPKEDLSAPNFIPFEEESEYSPEQPEEVNKWKKFNATVTERELIRVLFEFGHEDFEIDLPVAAYLVSELQEFTFENAEFQAIIQQYIFQLERGKIPSSEFFITHSDETISTTAIHLMTSPYELSENWEKMHGFLMTEAIKKFKSEIIDLINRFKLYQVMKMLDENLEKMKKATSDSNITKHMKKHQHLLALQQQLADLLGAVVIR